MVWQLRVLSFLVVFGKMDPGQSRTDLFVLWTMSEFLIAQLAPMAI
jgi:hypothetical protein